MTTLGCTVDTCGYNKDCCCCRSNIVVGGDSATCKDDTCCTSFKEEHACKNSTSSPNASLNVNCDATQCIYNDNRKCGAPHIDIAGATASTSTQTLCSTFVAK